MFDYHISHSNWDYENSNTNNFKSSKICDVNLLKKVILLKDPLHW